MPHGVIHIEKSFETPGWIILGALYANIGWTNHEAEQYNEIELRCLQTPLGFNLNEVTAHAILADEEVEQVLSDRAAREIMFTLQTHNSDEWLLRNFMANVQE